MSHQSSFYPARARAVTTPAAHAAVSVRMLGFALLALTAMMLMVPTGGAHAQGLERLPDFRTLVKSNKNAVVNIRTTQEVTTRRRGGGGGGFNLPDVPEDHPFYDFFKRFGEPGGPGGPRGPGGEPQQAQSAGSGFVISTEGMVLTNHHVIDGADEIVVRLADQREFKAELVGSDERSDVAVLKIDASGLTAATIGDSDSLEVGEWVLAIGSPFGLDFTATQGIVSALARSLPADNYVPFIQTDVAVNPGNSGGPLLNTKGEVVGINSQIFSRSGGYQGISFAIPMSTAMAVAKQLQNQGYVSRGWLGVGIQRVDQDLASSFGLERPRGALVLSVADDSPASDAKIKPGDIILEFDGHPIPNVSALAPIVGETPVGKRVKVLILREGKRKTLTVKIQELEDDTQVASNGDDDASNAGALGVQARDLTDEQRERRSIEDGGALITSVEPRSAASKAGIRSGDVILRFGNSSVDGAKSLSKAVKSAPTDRPISVLIQRGENPLFVAVTLEE